MSCSSAFSFYLHLSVWSWEQQLSAVVLKGCFMCEHPSGSSPAFLVRGLLWVWVPARLSSACAGCRPLGGGCAWCRGDQSLHWMCGRASSLLGDCHSPVGGRVCPPVVGVGASRCSSQSWCEAGGTGAPLLGKELLRVSPQELSDGMCDSCDATRHPECVPAKSTVTGAAPTQAHLRCSRAGNQLRFRPHLCMWEPTESTAAGAVLTGSSGDACTL